MQPPKRINREYLFNVINTVQPDFFPEAIKQALDNRRNQRMDKHDAVYLVPEIFYNLQKYAFVPKDTRGRTTMMMHEGASRVPR